jgi:hypothetical protein
LEGATGGYFDRRLHTVRSVIQATPEPRFAVSADYTLNRLAKSASPALHSRRTSWDWKRG